MCIHTYIQTDNYRNTGHEFERQKWDVWESWQEEREMKKLCNYNFILKIKIKIFLKSSRCIKLFSSILSTCISDIFQILLMYIIYSHIDLSV